MYRPYCSGPRSLPISIEAIASITVEAAVPDMRKKLPRAESSIIVLRCSVKHYRRMSSRGPCFGNSSYREMLLLLLKSGYCLAERSMDSKSVLLYIEAYTCRTFLQKNLLEPLKEKYHSAERHTMVVRVYMVIG